MGRKKEDAVRNYDAQTLRNALKRKYRSAAEIGEIIGKSHSWVSAVLQGGDASGSRANTSELKLLCALAGLEYEDILLPEEEEKPVVETPVAPQPVVQPPVVNINQNIVLTDDQFTWAKDAYLLLRKDEAKRHEETMERLDNLGKCLVEIMNRLKELMS